MTKDKGRGNKIPVFQYGLILGVFTAGGTKGISLHFTVVASLFLLQDGNWPKTSCRAAEFSSGPLCYPSHSSCHYILLFLNPPSEGQGCMISMSSMLTKDGGCCMGTSQFHHFRLLRWIQRPPNQRRGLPHSREGQRVPTEACNAINGGDIWDEPLSL